MLRTFEQKISIAVEKVKALKEEKNELGKKLIELENVIRSKDQEIERLSSEKVSIKGQIEDLLTELESIDLK